MPDIMIVLACASQSVESTSLRHLGRVIEAMLSISGRVTMRGLSRWTGSGGSYRTIQHLFNTSVYWCHLHWLLIRQRLLDADWAYVIPLHVRSPSIRYNWRRIVHSPLPVPWINAQQYHRHEDGKQPGPDFQTNSNITQRDSAGTEQVKRGAGGQEIAKKRADG